MKKLFTLFAIMTIAIINVNGQSWSEDFENGTLPDGWVNESNATDGGWLFGADLGSASFPIPAHTIYAGTNDDECNCDKSNDNLITFAFDIPAEGITVLSFSYYFIDGDYLGDDETAKVKISTDDGATWIELVSLPGVSEWTISNIVLSSYAGQNVKLSFSYDDGGGWNYGLAFDDIVVGSLMDYNLVAEELMTPEIFTTEDGDFVISAYFFNNGAIEVTDFTFNYSINGGDVVSSEVTGLALGSFDLELIDHPVPFTPFDLGDKTITAWASNINGQTDVNSNQTSGSIQFTNQHSTRTGLSETFTSNTCAPCAGFNPPYQAQLDLLNTNNSGSNYVAIKYQVNWPSPGNDVCYNPDVQTRIAYYGVTGVPNTFVESITANYDYSFPAVSWEDATENTALQFQDLTALHGWVNINASATWNGSSLTVDVSVIPNANFDASTHKLYVAVINNYYDNTEINPNGTNGETEWSYVVRKMLPDGNGTTLEEMTTGDEMDFNFDYQFEIGNVSAGGYNLVNGDIKVIAWVQENDSKLIRNATLSSIFTGINEVSGLVDFNVYPNPTNNVAHIAMNLLESNTVRLEVVDLLGKVVYAENMGQVAAGNQLFDVDASSIGNGMYMFNIYVGEQKVTKRVSISK
jgi:hypothetical protein